MSQHLGGHLNITHVDKGILKFFKEQKGCHSLLDVGCGPGGQVVAAQEMGYKYAVGVDGDPNVKKDFTILHDFTVASLEIEQEFDLGWSCEFVEHVDAQFIENYMPLFTKCRYIAITHAPPNTKGHHHVNCQTGEYWKEVFAKYNMKFNKELTDLCRNASTMRRDFFRKNGLVFENIL